MIEGWHRPVPFPRGPAAGCRSSQAVPAADIAVPSQSVSTPRYSTRPADHRHQDSMSPSGSGGDGSRVVAEDDQVGELARR